MQRRRYLALSVGTVATLGGCLADTRPSAVLSREKATPIECPPVLDVERTVCPGQDGPVTVDRSRRSVSGDSWSLVVTVTNRTDQPIGLTPYGWSVFRWGEDGWRSVAADAHIDPWQTLASGERYAWQLTAGSNSLDDADQRVLLDLGPGDYAFAVRLRKTGSLGAVAVFDVTS